MKKTFKFYATGKIRRLQSIVGVAMAILLWFEAVVPLSIYLVERAALFPQWSHSYS